MTLFTPQHVQVTLKTAPIFIAKSTLYFLVGYIIGTLLEKWETSKPIKIFVNILIFAGLSIIIPRQLGELQETIPGLFFASIFNTQPSLFSPSF